MVSFLPRNIGKISCPTDNTLRWGPALSQCWEPGTELLSVLQMWSTGETQCCSVFIGMGCLCWYSSCRILMDTVHYTVWTCRILLYCMSWRVLISGVQILFFGRWCFWHEGKCPSFECPNERSWTILERFSMAEVWFCHDKNYNATWLQPGWIGLVGCFL